MKRHVKFAGIVAAVLMATMAVVSAQRPGGPRGSATGPRGSATDPDPRGGAEGQGPRQGVGRLVGGPGGGPMFGRAGRPGMVLGGLDLTDDQQAQVKALLAGERESAKAGAQALAEARHALHAAVFASVVDTGAVAALQAKVAAAAQTQSARQIQTQLALSGILTAEQRARVLARGGRSGRGGGK